MTQSIKGRLLFATYILKVFVTFSTKYLTNKDVLVIEIIWSVILVCAATGAVIEIDRQLTLDLFRKTCASEIFS